MKPCKYFEKDGAGQYCKMISMEHDEDYPHKYWRVFCYGDTTHINCEIKKAKAAE